MKKLLGLATIPFGAIAIAPQNDVMTMEQYTIGCSLEWDYYEDEGTIEEEHIVGWEEMIYTIVTTNYQNIYETNIYLEYERDSYNPEWAVASGDWMWHIHSYSTIESIRDFLEDEIVWHEEKISLCI